MLKNTNKKPRYHRPRIVEYSPSPLSDLHQPLLRDPPGGQQQDSARRVLELGLVQRSEPKTSVARTAGIPISQPTEGFLEEAGAYAWNFNVSRDMARLGCLQGRSWLKERCQRNATLHTPRTEHSHTLQELSHSPSRCPVSGPPGTTFGTRGI